MSASDNNLWQKCLSELKLQLTQATYDTWFLRSTGIHDGNRLTIIVTNEYARDWFENRLRSTIERTVTRVAGRPLDLAFVVRDDDPADLPKPTSSRPDDDTDTDVPPDCRIAIEIINFDPTTAGFVMTSNYAWQFWQPYLAAIEREAGARNTGIAFCLWNTLRSFPAAWQETGRIQWPSIHTLADMVAGGDRFRIRGRNERGKGQSKRGRVIGALEILEGQRIVWPRTYGVGKDMVYVFRVTDSLPLLTPGQVARLSARLQERHALILDRCKLDYEEWEQLALPTLLNEG